MTPLGAACEPAGKGRPATALGEVTGRVPGSRVGLPAGAGPGVGAVFDDTHPVDGLPRYGDEHAAS
ncbi:hypothetical protein ACIA6T_15335 [Streptomyces sp. NPDC051740]|uniref:hypothetical protein n=1 Tax=Streptomyces sp. NPDC051740 TaxID=3365673 RepID=UPI0037A9FFC9